MNVRITKTSDAYQTVLHIDGQLHAGNVIELNREFNSVDGPLMLDLSNLLSADMIGVEVLLKMIALGARTRGTSHYIELLLQGSSCSA